jgi:hypothetical protein
MLESFGARRLPVLRFRVVAPGYRFTHLPPCVASGGETHFWPASKRGAAKLPGVPLEQHKALSTPVANAERETWITQVEDLSLAA